MSRARKALTLAYASRLPLRSILIGAVLSAPPPKDSTVRMQAWLLGIPCTALFLFLGWALNSGFFFGVAAFCTLMFFLTKNKGL